MDMGHYSFVSGAKSNEQWHLKSKKTTENALDNDITLFNEILFYWRDSHYENFR